MKVTVLIWQCRNQKGFTLMELEKLTGISHSALGNYENNKRSPRLDQLALIADALNLNITDLFIVEK